MVLLLLVVVLGVKTGNLDGFASCVTLFSGPRAASALASMLQANARVYVCVWGGDLWW